MNKSGYNSNNKRLVYLLNVLNVHSKIKDNSVLGTSFIDEARKRNIRLDSSCLDRKCSLNQDEISFILSNKISQYVTIPFSIIEKNLEYDINKFTFYSIKNIIDKYNKYCDFYDIAFSSQLVNNKKMIYLSCLKNKTKFFLRSESTESIIKNLNIFKAIIIIRQIGIEMSKIFSK